MTTHAGDTTVANGAHTPCRTQALLDQLVPTRRTLVLGARHDLRAAMPREGVAVSYAEDVAALAVYAHASFDALVLDAASWGVEAWLDARAEHALESVPVVLVLRVDDASRGDAYQALDTVTRPICPRELTRRLDVATELGRHRRAGTVAEAALAASGYGITVADAHGPDLPLVYANQAFERLTGYRASEVIGKNCRLLQGVDSDSETLASLRSAVRRGQAADVRLRNYRRDGSAFWNDLSIRPVTDGAGRVRYLLGVQRDVSSLVEAEGQLAAARTTTFLEVVLDELPAGVLTADAAGRVTFVNRAGLSALGAELGDAVGATMGDVLQLPHEVRLGGRDRRQRLEYSVTCRDGRRAELGLTFTPTGGIHPNIAWFVLFRDLTPDREATQTSRRTERLAAMGTMVAGFAHEVRNPVAAMHSVLEVLDDELPPPDPRRAYVGKLQKHLERVERLVKTSLRFGRPSPPQKSLVEPARLVDEALEQMRVRVATLGAIRREVEPELPRVTVDESQMVQVLVALLNNALDATGYPDQVLVRASLVAGEVRLEVEDHGPGIPPHVVGRMFDPFFTTKATGTGLGLSIAQRLAHDNGATIEVSNSVGGATMIVRVRP